jgi:hypothetical protein
MHIRLLTPDDAESFWHLRLEAPRNDLGSFADSPSSTRTSQSRWPERLGVGDPA